MKFKSLAVALLACGMSMSAMADKPLITDEFLDSLHLQGEKIADCSMEMILAYDGDASKWMTGQMAPVKGKEVDGRKVYHKIWHYGDGSPAATLLLDAATLDVVEYKDEEGSHLGKAGEQYFVEQCRDLKRSNKEAFGEE